MTFPWLQPSAPVADGPAHRLAAAQRELRERSALLARLGLSVADATARLSARVAWDYDPGSPAGGRHVRPAELSDVAIAKLVADVYASKRY